MEALEALNLAALRLAQIKHKLQWSANSEWSAHITPEECQLLLKELEKPRRSGQIFHGDAIEDDCDCEEKGRIHFDRSICACGMMHYFCDHGNQVDPCEDTKPEGQDGRSRIRRKR